MNSAKEYSVRNCNQTCIDDLITQYDSLSVSSSETDNITLDSGIYFDSKSDLYKQSVSSNPGPSKHMSLVPPPPPPPYNSSHNIISSILDSSDVTLAFHQSITDQSVSDSNSNTDICSKNNLFVNSLDSQTRLSDPTNPFSLTRLLTEERKQQTVSLANYPPSESDECLSSHYRVQPDLESHHRNPMTVPMFMSQQNNCNIINNNHNNNNNNHRLLQRSNNQFPSQYDSPRTNTKYLKEQTDDIKILGSCNKCQCLVTDSESACIALGKLYHSNCFTCCHCSRSLRGKVFYKDQEKIYCENDYMVFGFHKSMKVCSACGHIVTETILEALGKDFHPRCFKCSICQKCLDGIPFTVDRNNNIYCILDYHNTFAPRCAVCLQPIIPCKDSDDVVRVVVNDRDFHVECYRCQNCLKLLSNESNCFVWTTDRSEANIKLLCRKCYVNEIRELSRLRQL